VSDALAKGKVFVNGSEAAEADAGSRIRAGDVVGVWMDKPGSAQRRRREIGHGALEILYEDDQLMVINKPAGLLAVPLAQRADAPSAYDSLREHLRSRGKRKPLVVHRIDRDTSGLLVFASRLRAQEHLKNQFQRRDPERVYLAVVHGHPQPLQGVWRDYLVWDAEASFRSVRIRAIRRRKRPSATTVSSKSSATQRWSKFAWRQASGIRFAFRRGFTAIRWSANAFTRPAQGRFVPLPSSARPFTPIGCRSIIPAAAGG
jgi:23S rRNA-/tRNA-specific pseudouridylate synthase